MSETTPLICVTGANGFLGSHIVDQCLRSGYRVRATVRQSLDSKKIQHLRELDGAESRLEIVSAVMHAENSTGFKAAIVGCDAMIHVASPTKSNQLAKEDVHAAVFGTLHILRIAKHTKVKTVVMTSSMCAAYPILQGAMMCETNWSEARDQVDEGNTYAASKTLAEYAAWKFLEEEKPDFRLVTILPSCIVGPSLGSDIGLTNRALLGMIKRGCDDDTCPDDWFSFIDVRDCAAHHLAALEKEDASGRYFSAASNMHWNELCKILCEINPKLEKPQLHEDPTQPTRIDRSRQDRLGVCIREIPAILADAALHFNDAGIQDARNWRKSSRHSTRTSSLSMRRRSSRSMSDLTKATSDIDLEAFTTPEDSPVDALPPGSLSRVDSLERFSSDAEERYQSEMEKHCGGLNETSTGENGEAPKPTQGFDEDKDGSSYSGKAFLKVLTRSFADLSEVMSKTSSQEKRSRSRTKSAFAARPSLVESMDDFLGSM